MRKNSQGKYIYIMDMHGHPMADSRGRILEHRYVMSQHLGRDILSTEIVHHKDENKKNNDLSNLELLTYAEHAKLHHRTGRTWFTLVCVCCGMEFKREKKGIHKNTRYCSRSCSVKSQDKTTISEDKISKIRELRLMILSYAKIALIINVDRNTVGKYVRLLTK